MDQGQRAVVILTLLGEAFQALEMEADVEQVMCSSLAEAVDADAAVCYVMEESGARAVSCHPDELRTDGLLRWAGAHPVDEQDDALVSRTHPELGQVLLVAPAPALPDGFDPGNRALAFAREDGFGAEQVALLREAVPVLLTLLPHVVAATERRDRAELGRQAAREFGLTSRELEVLDLLSQGMLATSIASRLSLSPRTVHKHLGNIYDKLGVHDRLVAVSLARGRGLVNA